MIIPGNNNDFQNMKILWEEEHLLLILFVDFVHLRVYYRLAPAHS